MITVSVAEAAWLATAGKDVVAYWLVITRRDETVLRATNFGRDLTIGADVYQHSSGGAVSNIESEAALSVNNAEITAIFDQITEEDVRIGMYDGAAFSFGVCNPDDTTVSIELMSGTFGQFSFERLKFQAELRSLMQQVQQTFGYIATPTCPYQTYGEECGLDEDDFRDTGTLEGVSDDQMTFFDSSRVEAGPTGAIQILSITNANPAVVTLASSLGLVNGSSIALHDVVGMPGLNGTTTAHDISYATFTIPIDTTDAGTFASGNVTPLSGDAGFYGYGTMRFLEGPNAVPGIEREVKVSLPGQWTVQEPFPFEVVGDEDYEITHGDDHTFNTCKTKFANGRRFGGDPFVRGQDDLMQVGRQQ